MGARDGSAAQALAGKQLGDGLMAAVRSGDLPAFKRHMRGEEHADRLRDSVRDEYGRGLLHHAAQMGHAELSAYLLDALGFDANDQDRRGETPATLACAMNRPQVLQLLLARGASVARRQEPAGVAPVHRAAACEGGSLECLRLVLDAGGDPGMPSGTGTPLCWAAGAGHTEAVKLLLERGADPNATSSEEVSALGMAIMAGGVETASLLLAAGADPNAPVRGGSTPLHIAAAMSGNQAREAKLVAMLLEAGANPDAHDADGHTPVATAALAEHAPQVQALLPHTRPVPGVEPWGAEGLAAWARRHVERVAAGTPRSSSSAPPPSVASTSESGEERLRVALPRAEEPDKEKALQMKRKGDEAFVRQDYAASVEAYTVSFRHDTSSAAVWANRAAALLRLGRASEALEDARRSRAVDKGFAKAWYREGSALAALKQWEDAALAFFEGCQLAPDNKEFEAAFKGAIAEARKEYLAKQQR